MLITPQLITLPLRSIPTEPCSQGQDVGHLVLGRSPPMMALSSHVKKEATLTLYFSYASPSRSFGSVSVKNDGGWRPWA